LRSGARRVDLSLSLRDQASRLRDPLFHRNDDRTIIFQLWGVCQSFGLASIELRARYAAFNQALPADVIPVRSGVHSLACWTLGAAFKVASSELTLATASFSAASARRSWLKALAFVIGALISAECRRCFARNQISPSAIERRLVVSRIQFR